MGHLRRPRGTAARPATRFPRDPRLPNQLFSGGDSQEKHPVEQRIVVREALTLEGIVYGPDMEIPPEVWRRVPTREQNKLLNTAKVERHDE